MDGRRHTQRLALTPVTEDQFEDLLLVHVDPAVVPWYGEPDSEALRTQARRMGATWAGGGVHKWLARHRETGEVVGRGGCSRIVLDAEPCVEMGWAVRGPFQGQGYATEIGQASLDFAFSVLGADSVVAFTEVHNLASQAVMRRLGMIFDKQLQRPGLIEGRPGIHADAAFVVFRARPDAPPVA
ncbi:MAG: GNAT family N-acetyltransferase [Propionibacteriales bacterium]|nr:GNAT family N-acetyltransferase [Propionibacteriales bacterium]